MSGSMRSSYSVTRLSVTQSTLGGLVITVVVLDWMLGLGTERCIGGAQGAAELEYGGS